MRWPWQTSAEVARVDCRMDIAMGNGHGRPDGTSDDREHGAEYGDKHGSKHGGQDGGQDVSHDVSHDGSDAGTTAQPVEFVVVGNSVYRPGREPIDADAHAFDLLFWLCIRKFPEPQFPATLWVSAKDLEDVLYGEFLAYVGWQAHPWRRVAHELRKHTCWRQRDGRQGADRRGPSITQYLVRGKPKRPKRGKAARAPAYTSAAAQLAA
jgi:hypothetical protein